MATKGPSTVSRRFLLLVVSVVIVLLGWSMVRYWLASISFSQGYIHFIDVGVVVATGLGATIALVRLIARPIASRVGPTYVTTVRLVLQLVGLALVVTALILLSGPTGSSFLSALVGIGFFGIVLGLAAQSVLGNLFSGLMILAARPFNINDRIALVTWQYGKFPPSLSHGWLEPAYTGIVKSITLTYTRILTDSGALLKVPNSIVTQSLIMNIDYGRQGAIATQFEAPIQIEPEQLHEDLNSKLAKVSEFKAEEANFDILEVSSSGYLVSVSYNVAKQTERQMKTLLLGAVREILIHADQKMAKQS
jgi:small-conductance mechanosensitive channel